MLPEDDILNFVGNELSQSVGSSETGFISGNREAALAAYLGQPNGKEVEGRSTVVSTDVADAIEWIMPEVVKAFTQNNEVVTFDAEFEGDEEQSELESCFVYDILMKDNNGFVLLHTIAKDALLQKNGFAKVFFDPSEETKTENYQGLTDMEFEMLLADDEVDILEKDSYEGEDGLVLFDAKIKRTKRRNKICVEPIAPEDFRINSRHHSVDVSNARFSAHVMMKTAGELIEMGVDKAVIDEIPTFEQYDFESEYRFYMQGESSGLENEPSGDPSLRPIEIAECCMRMDYDEDGIAEMVKVTVAGGTNPTHLIDIEPIDGSPFISCAAILMSHKLFGLSIYDRLKEIQEQKTSLWRNILDNMYLQNNQRTIVVENQVNLDDLMISRPGGIIRVKRPDAVMPYQTPPLSGDSYQMMDYLDRTRTGRSGVSPEGAVTDNMIGDRVGSQGVDRMMNQKEELVGLIIRVMAEVFVKPLCYKIRDEARKNVNEALPYYFRGQWKNINPAMWKDRSRTTVRVGTGSGNRKEQQAALSQILMMQEKIMANPGQAMVQEDQVFNAMNDLAKFSGMPGIRRYLLDPKSPEGQQFKQQVQQSQQQAQQAEMQEKQMMAETAAKIAEAESQKAKVAEMNAQLKAQVDFQKNQLTLQKQQSDLEMQFLKQQLEETKTLIDSDEENEDLKFKYYELQEKLDVERERIAAQAKAAAQNNKESSNETSGDS